MAAIDQSDRYANALHRQQVEFERDRDERQMLWIFLWTLFGFKMVSVGVLIWWMEWQTFVAIVGMTTWPWLIIPGAALAGPVVSKLRMRRIRRKRTALRRAEFESGQPAAAPTGANLLVIDQHDNVLNLDEGRDSDGKPWDHSA